MARREKEVNELRRIIAPYGLRIVDTSKHRRIETLEGKPIYSFSSSPSRPFFAKNTLSDLIKIGVIPTFEWENRHKLV